MRYIVELTEEEHHRYIYEVEADNPQEAEDKARSEDIEYSHKKFLGGEVVWVEVTPA